MFPKIQLIKTLKKPTPTQAKIGKNRGGFSMLLFPEIKKPNNQTNPKITSKISSTLISRSFPLLIFPAEKLGEKPIASTKRNTGRISRKLFFRTKDSSEKVFFKASSAVLVSLAVILCLFPYVSYFPLLYILGWIFGCVDKRSEEIGVNI